MQCEGCKEKRASYHQAPRQLIEVEITSLGESFLKKTDPITVCIYCDGGAHEAIEDVIFKLQTQKKK